MAIVNIPSLLRELTDGASRVEIPGRTVREVIIEMENLFPGVCTRLCEEGQIRPNISVVIDGVASEKKMRHQLEPDSEVHFLPIMAGG